MSWFKSRLKKTSQRIESIDDVQLRSDISQMLGLKTQPDEDITAESHHHEELAQSLYLEALRRRRTLRHRSSLSWILAAASIPIIFATAIWGISQNQKAKALAQQIELNRLEQQRLVDTNQNLQKAIQDAQLQLAKDYKQYPVLPLPDRKKSVNELDVLKVRNKSN